MNRKKILMGMGFLILFLMLLNTVSATMNLIVVTDPSGKDPNGMAAGSMSYAENMFQSTFLMSNNKQFTVLSGGEGNSETRLRAIVNSVAQLENGASASSAASVASSYPGIRLVTGGPKIGAAMGGSFDGYLVIVQDDGTIDISPVKGGLAVVPPGKKGALIHLRNSKGNPLMGSATYVRKEAALEIGRMIRDGYSATYIVGETMGYVAKYSGEKHGGGAVNLISSISTGDMFTPENINETGYPMDEPYVKYCKECGWSVSYPAAESYTNCPYDGSKLDTIYAYKALEDAITVTQSSVSVSIYGSDKEGVAETTKDVVTAAVKKNGYDATYISNSLNKAIKNGLIVGVNYVEPKDINVNNVTRAVGVYYNPLPDERTAPSWNLPIPSSVLDILGNLQTAIGIILILLLLFRSSLLDSFKKHYKK